MTNQNSSLINSAVLVPIYKGIDGKLRLILIRRKPGGVHGNQIAFPGGKAESADPSLLDTALRETEEEIGLLPERVRILAELPPVLTGSSGFRIFPFLGVVQPVKWILDAKEVAEIIDIPVESLAGPSVYGEEIMQYDNWPEPRCVAFYRIGSYKLWGASFRILQPILPKIISNDWRL